MEHSTYWLLEWDPGQRAWIATQRTAPGLDPFGLRGKPVGDEEPTGKQFVFMASCAQHMARLVRIRYPGAPCCFRWSGDLLWC